MSDAATAHHSVESGPVVDATSPLRVLLWSLLGAGLHYNGPGISAYRLYRNAPRDRFHIALAHGRPDQDDYPLFTSQHLIAPFNAGTLVQLRFSWAARQWMREHIREHQIFHGLGAYETTVNPALQAEAAGVPAFIKLTMHKRNLIDKPTLRSKLGVARRRREKIKRLSGIIAISQPIVEELREYGIPESKIASIPNGVDLDVFHPPALPEDRTKLRAELGWPERPTLVFVGSMVQRKQPHLLLEALINAHKNGHEMQLALVGPEGIPEYCAELRARARDAGVEEFVIWVGFTKDVASAVRAGEMYGLVSRIEGMPNALLEAMASGAACIGSRISGTSQLIESGHNGMLVDQTVESVSDAVLQYLESPETGWAHGQAARALVEQSYSSKAVLDAHERMFRRVLAGGDASE